MLSSGSKFNKSRGYMFVVAGVNYWKGAVEVVVVLVVMVHEVCRRRW